MSKGILIEYWLAKSGDDLESAYANFYSNRLQNAVRDAYFACFHAFAALLLKEGKAFKRHKEVRSALHRDYVHLGKMAPVWGKHYDWLFENRQKADYRPLVQFESEQVKEIIELTGAFVTEMKRLLSEEPFKRD
jgi:uncharacterized protein (UPF0332 family)